MPRYFLDIHDRAGDAPDDEGQELSGPEAAHRAAVEGIRSLLASELAGTGAIDLGGYIDVRDRKGSVLESVRFADVIEIRGS